MVGAWQGYGESRESFFAVFPNLVIFVLAGAKTALDSPKRLAATAFVDIGGGHDNIRPAAASRRHF
tara:strand:+ start:304 stop:501 length:198 start_codon:yes stop_codon:yes gene_type:complete